MKEEFKNLMIEHFTDYKISNYGYIVNRYNKIISPRISKNGVMIDIKKRRGKEVIARFTANLDRLVYKYFIGNIDDITRVFHKDNDITNNRVDNLYIKRTEPSQCSIDMFNKYAIHFVYHYCIRRWLHCSKEGLDLDNIIGEALLISWKHLYHFNKYGYEDVKMFYHFCADFCKTAFRKEFKNRKKFGLVADECLYRIGLL